MKDLSFIVVGRNDNYGGDFLRRMQIFVNVLFELAAKTRRNIELVIVEWNPPKDRARLANAISWPQSIKDGMAVIVTVPERNHKNLPNHETVPLFEWVGKNVGIRRAKGEYIIVTNPDIIFTKSLFSFISSRNNLKQTEFYRVDRYDVSKEIPMSDSTAIERFCELNWTRINASFGSLERENYVSPSFMERFVHRSGLGRVHTNGSGDFLLMSKENWNKFKGYPELNTIDHVDSYMCFIAGVFLKQSILKYRIYHQEHSREDQKGKPRSNWEDIYKTHFSNSFSHNQGVYFFNHQNQKDRKMSDIEELTPNTSQWGLNDVEDLEIVNADPGKHRTNL